MASCTRLPDLLLYTKNYFHATIAPAAIPCKKLKKTRKTAPKRPKNAKNDQKSAQKRQKRPKILEFSNFHENISPAALAAAKNEKKGEMKGARAGKCKTAPCGSK
ncbi:MAG TPA: hypothetical protein PKM67_02865 [Kiritimatiellia bacterium]|nr:hypothetical protein [Kiritimatiellia bacterium]HNR93688.1 hypothetical protein [Kiritimatiellia bacterium]HNS80380.1 hypothetical protein [Kiritimatiellia bacterium]